MNCHRIASAMQHKNVTKSIALQKLQLYMNISQITLPSEHSRAITNPES